LTAALLLLVWLMAGYQSSRCACGQAPVSKAREASPQSRDAEVPVQLLHASIRQSEQQLGDLERRIPRLRREIETLIEQMKEPTRGTKPRDGNNNQGETQVREEHFRLPREEITDQKMIGFVCENNRVSLIDSTAFKDRIVPVAKRALANLGKKETFKYDDIPDSDFGMEGSVQISAKKGLELVYRLVRIPGRLGETPEEIRRPESRFQRVLRAHQGNTREFYVSFAVLPDSYDAFRKARFLVWSAGFDVGWAAMDTGEKVELGSGVGVKGT
jgi:hypothetical protein